MQQPTAWVYIVECADGTLYTGWCREVTARIAAHNTGRGAKYTRSRLPVVLRWCEPQVDKRVALQREYQIKQLSRERKLDLFVAVDISYPQPQEATSSPD